MAEITVTTFAEAREMDASTTRPYFGRYPVVFTPNQLDGMPSR